MRTHACTHSDTVLLTAPARAMCNRCSVSICHAAENTDVWCAGTLVLRGRAAGLQRGSDGSQSTHFEGARAPIHRSLWATPGREGGAETTALRLPLARGHQLALPSSKSGFFFRVGRGSSFLIFKCWKLIKHIKKVLCVQNTTEPRAVPGSQAPSGGVSDFRAAEARAHRRASPCLSFLGCTVRGRSLPALLSQETARPAVPEAAPHPRAKPKAEMTHPVASQPLPVLSTSAPLSPL